MAYRSNEREPRTARSNPEWTRSYGGMWRPAPPVDSARETRSFAQPERGRTPLIVDDTVLACCNHAFDIASANGSPEVLLEHLLHAMTRIPAAAQVLEAHRVQVMGLRRESAITIANDLPISPGHSGKPAKTSGDMKTVLGLAGSAARSRGTRPISVEDVLAVMLGYDRPSGAVEMLRRFAPGVARQQAQPQPRYYAPARLADPEAATALALHALERDLLRLSREVATDREVLGGMVGSLRDTIETLHAEFQTFRSAMVDRLERLEQTFDAGWAAWGSRRHMPV